MSSYGFQNAGARKSFLEKHLVVTEHSINIFIESIPKNENILRNISLVRFHIIVCLKKKMHVRNQLHPIAVQ